jgi:hypothetical protein
MTRPVISTYTFGNAAGPFAPAQTNGGATTQSLLINGPGTTFSNNHLNLPAKTYLNAGAAGITLPTNADPALTQTPASMTLIWTGILPSAEAPLLSIYEWEKARFALYSHWDVGRLRLRAVSTRTESLGVPLPVLM